MPSEHFLIFGAFDRVSGHAIINAIKEHAVENYIVDWYEHYFKNRISSLKLQSSCKTKLISDGCPQGGCLSILAWNLVFDKLLQKLKKLKVTIVRFADDAALVATGTHPGPIILRLNQALKLTKAWAEEQSLELSKEKTCAILFTR